MAKYRLSIYADDMYEGPRQDNDFNMGLMACWHRDRNLGDNDAKELLLAEIRKTRTNFKHNNPRELYVACEQAGMVVMPIYGYEHGDITIATTPFSCRFDSGQLGFIAASKSRVREVLGVGRITAKSLRKVFDALQAEVDIYDTYLREGGTGYELKKYQNGAWVHVGSCSGFLGTDFRENGIMDDVDSYIGDNDLLYLYNDDFDDYIVELGSQIECKLAA